MRTGGRTDGRAGPNSRDSSACAGIQLITKFSNKMSKKNSFYTKTQVCVIGYLVVGVSVQLINYLPKIILVKTFMENEINERGSKTAVNLCKEIFFY